MSGSLTAASVGAPDQAVNAVQTGSFGRCFTKLRLSITEACNLACFYCGGNAHGIMSQGVLSAKEIAVVCAGLCEQGIREIRITGGEPTMRQDLPAIISALSVLPLTKLGITTNGLLLKPLLPLLRDCACRHVNFSLDSLRPARFKEITGSDELSVVTATIAEAVSAGLQVKVNVVVLRGINDDEIFDYLDFSIRYGVEVRFLELMGIGPMHATYESRCVASAEIITRIQTRETLVPQLNEQDSTSFNYVTASGARIGFIASESRPFCAACSRLRLTARGTLRSCLMDDREVSVRGVAPDAYPELIGHLLSIKPASGRPRTVRSMCAIGG